ncbi:type II secretion system protein [Vampirovibrio sp.]|uniref:type II secretion system protein n=1 Tax=Vampirovibrio sp. TaxID=2717857 RepID=UPI0035941288
MPPLPKPWKRFPGFTLAELLIALAILGVIATFTVPKILNAQQDSRKKAVFKETLAALSNLTYEAAREGSVTNATTEWSYVLNNLNYAKICDTNLNDQGCWAPPLANNIYGFVLHNGAAIISFNAAPFPNESLQIDWNGLEPPNIAGEDILAIQVCFRGGELCPNPSTPGQIYVTPGSVYETLYQSIFE